MHAHTPGGSATETLCIVAFPQDDSDDFAAFVLQLLEMNAEKRLGWDGAHALKRHKWFSSCVYLQEKEIRDFQPVKKGFNWKLLEKRQMQVPLGRLP